jgi:hypothetical protein
MSEQLVDVLADVYHAPRLVATLQALRTKDAEKDAELVRLRGALGDLLYQVREYEKHDAESALEGIDLDTAAQALASTPNAAAAENRIRDYCLECCGEVGPRLRRRTGARRIWRHRGVVSNLRRPC